MEKKYSAHRGLLSLTAACLISFIFNHFDIQLRAHYESSVNLLRRGIYKNHPQPETHIDANKISISDFSDEYLSSINIPGCAKDVFLKLTPLNLNHDDSRDSEEEQCRGLLIRDDIILTSKTCSKLTFAFNFPGDNVGTLSASPHTSLNIDEDLSLVDQRLGFLEANPTYHYHFVHEPARRARVFLSQKSATAKATVLAMTCNKHKPIAHNFPVDGEMVPLGHLLKVLPDDNILWEETDIASALTLKDNAHRWWTRSVTLKDEETKFKSMLNTYSGPPGGVSIPNAHANHGYLSQASALCEAIDPRHRLQYCFKNYFFRWREQVPFSGMRFFDWLDYGQGKFLLERNETEKMIMQSKSDFKCFKKDFNNREVYYYSDEERDAHEVYLQPSEDGSGFIIARYKLTNEPVSRSPPGNPQFYMWDLHRILYVVDDTNWDEETFGQIKHTSILAGRPALSAGHVYFGDDGRIEGINYVSGHYKPSIGAVSMMHRWMKDDMDFNISSVEWIGRMVWSTEDCKRHDWNGMKVLGYDGVALNQSCHEVTTSPMWKLEEDMRRRRR